MKVDEPAAAAAASSTPAPVDGATAPIASTSASTSTPAKKRKPAEPTSDRLSNLSRVTSAQLTHISFPPESRYVPVRTTFAASSGSVSTPPSTANGRPTGSVSIGLGGGILMMRDREPEKAAEFLEMEVTRVLQLEPIVDPAIVAAAAADDMVVDDGPIAPVPEEFEYNDWE